MFKGILNQNVPERRAVRRLNTVLTSSQRSRDRHNRETIRYSTRRLAQLRAREEEKKSRRRPPLSASPTPAPSFPVSSSSPSPSHSAPGVSRVTQAAWTAAQDAALAQEQVMWRTSDPMRAFHPEERLDSGDGLPSPSSSSSPSSAPNAAAARRGSALSYTAVDAESGDSVVQRRFNELVRRALLHYGPPLPVEVVMDNNIISAASVSPTKPHHRQHQNHHEGTAPSGTDDAEAVFMDEVGLRLHELMTILRKEEPHFSIREDCDGVPLSLLVRNCNYLRAYGGRVHYMRFVRRVPSESDGRGLRDGGDAPTADGSDAAREAAAVGQTMMVSLGKYKMREMPAQDGIRQGPQPWKYSYRTW